LDEALLDAAAAATASTGSFELRLHLVVVVHLLVLLLLRWCSCGVDAGERGEEAAQCLEEGGVQATGGHLGFN
jgi:hypothetical protein